MSQHLIIDFINRITTFKPIKRATIASRKIKKYQGSNRDNNELAHVVAQGAAAINNVPPAVNNERGEENKETSERANKIDIEI